MVNTQSRDGCSLCARSNPSEVRRSLLRLVVSTAPMVVRSLPQCRSSFAVSTSSSIILTAMSSHHLDTRAQVAVVPALLSFFWQLPTWTEN